VKDQEELEEGLKEDLEQEGGSEEDLEAEVLDLEIMEEEWEVNAVQEDLKEEEDLDSEEWEGWEEVIEDTRKLN